jgi:hypothetical protein
MAALGFCLRSITGPVLVPMSVAPTLTGADQTVITGAVLLVAAAVDALSRCRSAARENRASGGSGVEVLRR